VGIVKISARNQITVPAAIRARLHLKPGDTVVLQCEGTRVVLRPFQRNDFLKIAEALAPLFKGMKVDVKKARALHLERRFGIAGKA
jgi:AbrB family looped-hinge helix DNA binding protein